MKLYTGLQMREFDRIIFNFPHAGFYGKEDSDALIGMHRLLVHGFFNNARGMLRANGEIHVNHKMAEPYCRWDLPQLASMNSLEFIECADFRIEDFPGYGPKRGAGLEIDEPFPLGKCGTFKFRALPLPLKPSRVKNSVSSHGKSQAQQVVPVPVQTPPISYGWRPPSNSHGHASHMLGYTELQLHNEIRMQCCRIFSGYLNNAAATFGRNDFDVPRSVSEALRHGCERYKAEEPDGSLGGYINILEELRHLSTLKIIALQKMLSDI